MLQYLTLSSPPEEPVREPSPPIKHGDLPAWQQLIIESRQIRTVTNHLAHTLYQQVTTAKEHSALLGVLRERLWSSALWHCCEEVSTTK